MEQPNYLGNYFCLEDDMSSLEKYLHLGHKKLFKENERIFPVGEWVTQLCYVQSGRAGRLVSAVNGTEKMIRVVCDQSILGEVLFFTKQPPSNGGEFIALEPCVCYFFDEETVWQVLLKDERVLRDLIQWFCHRMSALNRQVTDSLVKDPHYRVCKFLYDYVRQFGAKRADGTYVYKGKLSHYDISKYLGINRVSVTNVIKQLQDEGVIQKERNRLTVLDMAYLEQLCSE